MFRRESTNRELRDRLKDLVRKPADIQDVIALSRLRRRVGLQVDAYQPRLRTSLL
jgi:hypothetical protein